MTQTHLHRPSPVNAPKAEYVDESTPPRVAARRLLAGELLVVSDRYRTGLGILERLREFIKAPGPEASYRERTDFQDTLMATARRLLIPVAGGHLSVDSSPKIGFLSDLYGKDAVLLPMPDVVDLHNAWRLYDEGVKMAVLGQRIHPFYGTYAPTRTVHLELFATWLSGWAGNTTLAVDVGTGCGILARMLCKAGFDQVIATDINPNAVESVRREVARNPAPITAVSGDLLDPVGQPADLIVFNPPWTHGPVNTALERSLHFQDGLFERFFEQAHAKLAPQGRVVLVFSNLIRLVQPDIPHPIDAELERGRFTLVDRIQRRVKPTPDKDGRRRRTKERVEVWELSAS